MNLPTQLIFNAGYVNDAVVPLTSTFLDTGKQWDKPLDPAGSVQTGTKNNLFTYAYHTLTTPQSVLFDYFLNYSSAYIEKTTTKEGMLARVFKDYHHDRMLNGAYDSKAADLLSNKTGFRSDAIRAGYINSVPPHANFSAADMTGMPGLTGEPLFIQINHDLRSPLDVLRAEGEALDVAISPSVTGTTVNFTATITPAAATNLSYEWDFGDQSPLSTLAAPSRAYGAEGSYTVTLKVSGSIQGHQLRGSTSLKVVTTGYQLDSDKDGMPDAWETLYGLNPNDPADADGDLNNNGVNNRQEYLNGTDPTAPYTPPGPPPVVTPISPTPIEIITPVLRLRSGPGTGYAILTSVSRGQKYVAHGKNGNWYQIDVPSPKTGSGPSQGWVALVEPVTGEILAREDSTALMMVVQNTGTLGLNVRTGPDTALYNAVAKVWDGQRFVRQAKSGNWYRMSLPANLGSSSGWSADVMPNDTLLIVSNTVPGIGDADGDGIPDSYDAFPYDPAASIDSDGDGYPDAWNPNATQAQIAASTLKIDAYPNDTARWQEVSGGNSGSLDIAAAEYFFDTDPGVGYGTPISPADGAFDQPFEMFDHYGIPTSGLGVGSHTISVRVKDANGVWSVVQSAQFEISAPRNGNGTVGVSAGFTALQPPTIAAAEYFFDTDPGVGYGTPIAPADGAFDQPFEMFDISQISTAQLKRGLHTLSVRVKDSNSKWSPVQSVAFDVEWSTIKDSDGDGVPDAQDAFPTDPAASVDTDRDGHPDAWNTGKTAADSTSTPPLTLDAFPNDSTKWAVNRAPASTSAGIVTAEDTPSTGVTPAVTDPDVGDTHTFTIVTGPAHGSANVVANKLVYTPSANYNGSDNFTFRATDAGGLFVDGTATVTVNAVNDAPAPTAPAIITAPGTAATSQVTHHDPDVGDTHTYAVTTQGLHGVASVNTAGLATYTPNTGFTGSDSFVVTVTDNGTPALSAPVTVSVSVNMPDIPWFEDAVPAGARTGGRGEGWNWVTANPTPYSGTSAHQSAIAAGWHYHYFYNATTLQQVAVGDSLYAYVYLDPANPPTGIVLGWRTGGSWEHRAYWGTAAPPWGTQGTASMMGMGALPATGQWVRLEIPASAVGLEGQSVDGMVFATLNGRSTWDQSGKFQAAPAPSFTISGTVTKNAAALAGVSMAGSTGANCTASDASGNYSCTVAQGWSGTVTPFLSGHTFTPVSRSYTNVTVSQTLQDYAAAVIPTFTISGTVTKNSAGLSGVSFSGSGASCNTSDASGNYSCTVAQGWSGTITPSIAGHTFTPVSYNYVNVTVSQTLQDYSATALTGIAWFEDAVPAGARTGGRGEGWNWVTANPTPYSGTSAHQSAIAAGWHYHYFYNATTLQQVAVGDSLYAYVYLDPANPPTGIVLGWRTGGSWEHRAYWGTAAPPWGTQGTASMMGMGALPATGQWVRLEIPASAVGLEGQSVDGMVFATLNGRSTWDQSGKF